MSTKTNGPERLQRFIELMMRGYVTNDVAYEDNGALRLQTFVDRIANDLGLKVMREMRYFEGGRPMMAYHLPKQDLDAVRGAVAQLSQFESNCGPAIRQLHDSHPFADGGLPDMPGISSAENSLLPTARRGDGGEHLNATILKLLHQKDVWLTSRYVNDHYESTRLAHVVWDYRRKGYVIDDEDRPNAGGKGVHSAYHIFTDQRERDAWLAEQVKKRYTQDEAKAIKAVKVSKGFTKSAKPAHKSLAATPHAGGSKFGGYVRTSVGQASAGQSTGQSTGHTAAQSSGHRQFFQPTAHQAPTKPPQGAMARLSNLQKAQVTPRFEVNSPAAVPARELNRAFPAAGSKAVFEMGGVHYIRKFRPRKHAETIVAWETYWDVAQPGAPAA